MGDTLSNSSALKEFKMKKHPKPKPRLSLWMINYVILQRLGTVIFLERDSAASFIRYSGPFLKLSSRLGQKNTPTAPLQSGKTPHPNKYPEYDTKQSDDEVQVMLELWGMRSTLSLPSLPGPLWSGLVAPDRALSMG